MICSEDRSGFEVSVRRVKGEAFNEYGVQHVKAEGAKHSVSSCWLESEAEATFEIKITVGPAAHRHNRGNDLVAVIYVDGRLVERNCNRRSSTENNTTISKMKFVEGGVMYQGQLKFATLRTTDNDEEITMSGAQLHSLGKIRVDFLRGTLGDVTNLPVNTTVDPDVGVASEKGKKMGGAIGYTDKKIAVPHTRSIRWTPKDTEALPYHRVDFNYRTRPVLQLLGVVEQDPLRPRVATPPEPQQPVAHAGPSRKRKVEVIDIDADEEESDVKPDNKERIATRLSWLERQLQNANNALKRRKLIVPVDMDIVDLTGDD